MKQSIQKTIVCVSFLLLCQSLLAKTLKDTNDVKQAYFDIVSKYQNNQQLIQSSWLQVAALYNDSSRYYHNLQHIANFYNELLRCKNELENWDAVFLAMVYHDVVYVATSRDNEEKSADMAKEHLGAMGFSQPFIDTCYSLIMATKSHKATGNNTTNLFIDADMSILGVPLDKYKQYVKQVHAEYAAVPNFAEKRKGFLKHFLGVDRLFITPLFYNLYEKSARYNLQQEIKDFQ
ncbi:HD domain-containing protein [Polluticaenibacter yanchengensis]|uniref:Metal-dependent HD superfamily phosphohydrolase n=1 Tax=Polluticaenibacter yanchengensis TaxID=3014562 RepID=A0ABT4UPS7_9BACT|nr:hypothetical protein [Chitinophagaceae bacterium LY-5]